MCLVVSVLCVARIVCEQRVVRVYRVVIESVWVFVPSVVLLMSEAADVVDKRATYRRLNDM